jgi:hypothetical protein
LKTIPWTNGESLVATIISNSSAKSLADSLGQVIGAGSSASKVSIYEGTQPSGGPDASGSGALIVEINLLSPPFGAAVDGNPGGTISVNGSPSGNALINATAGWFRVTNGDGESVLDGSCGGINSGADMELSPIMTVSGQSVSIQSWDIVMPEG